VTVIPGISNTSKHNRSKDSAAQIGPYARKHLFAVDVFSSPLVSHFRVSRPPSPYATPSAKGARTIGVRGISLPTRRVHFTILYLPCCNAY
jgi:hypothetical protein